MEVLGDMGCRNLSNLKELGELTNLDPSDLMHLGDLKDLGEPANLCCIHSRLPTMSNALYEGSLKLHPHQ